MLQRPLEADDVGASAGAPDLVPRRHQPPPCATHTSLADSLFLLQLCRGKLLLCDAKTFFHILNFVTQYSRFFLLNEDKQLVVRLTTFLYLMTTKFLEKCKYKNDIIIEIKYNFDIIFDFYETTR